MSGWGASEHVPYPAVVIAIAYINYKGYHLYSNSIPADDVLNEMVHNYTMQQQMEKRTKALEQVFANLQKQVQDDLKAIKH